MIRDNKIHQIDGVISSSPGQMRSMDQSLFELYKNGRITKETAIKLRNESGNAPQKTWMIFSFGCFLT